MIHKDELSLHWQYEGNQVRENFDSMKAECKKTKFNFLSKKHEPRTLKIGEDKLLTEEVREVNKMHPFVYPKNRRVFETYDSNVIEKHHHKSTSMMLNTNHKLSLQDLNQKKKMLADHN